MRIPGSHPTGFNPSSPAESGPGAAVSGAAAGAGRPWPAWVPAVLLGLVTLWLYWPATRCDFIIYDDPDYVTENPWVQAGLTAGNVGWALTTGHAGNWHPLTWLSLMLDEDLFGSHAAGFHFTNLILHAANAMLLFWLLRRLTGARWRSATVAALFAWHPLQVESVAWVAERKSVLCLCFGLLALLAYERYARAREAARRDPGAARAGARPIALSYGLAWCCFALGLMSKPMLVTWPFVLLLLDYWPLGCWQPGRRRALVLEKIPFLALTVAVCAVNLAVQKSGGAVVAANNLPWDARLGNALISYVRYLGKLFWPADLAVIYPYPGHYWPLGEVLLAAGLLAGLTLLVWANRRRYPFLLMGWLWFGGTLVPVIGLVQAGTQAMADRYVYIPLVGLLVMLVWGGYELMRGWRGQAPVLSVAVLAAVSFSLALTRQQLGCWRNSQTLFRHAVAVTDDNFIAHSILGVVLFGQGQTNAGINELTTAIRLEPNYAEAHGNLGFVWLNLGQTDAAMREFQTAIRLMPKFAEAHRGLALEFDQLGQTAAAAREYEESLRLRPDAADVQNSLGLDLEKLGRPEAAIALYRQAIRLLPSRAETHNNLGMVLARQGQPEAALNEFQEALRLNPDYVIAHYNLGIFYGVNGRIDEAIREFQAAVRIQPDFTNAQINLALALSLKKNSPAGSSPAPAPQ